MWSSLTNRPSLCGTGDRDVELVIWTNQLGEFLFLTEVWKMRHCVVCESLLLCAFVGECHTNCT